MYTLTLLPSESGHNYAYASCVYTHIVNLLWLLTTSTQTQIVFVVPEMYFWTHQHMKFFMFCMTLLHQESGTRIVVFEILTGVYHHRVQVLHGKI